MWLLWEVEAFRFEFEICVWQELWFFSWLLITELCETWFWELCELWTVCCELELLSSFTHILTPSMFSSIENSSILLVIVFWLFWLVSLSFLLFEFVGFGVDWRLYFASIVLESNTSAKFSDRWEFWIAVTVGVKSCILLLTFPLILVLCSPSSNWNLWSFVRKALKMKF